MPKFRSRPSKLDAALPDAVLAQTSGNNAYVSGDPASIVRDAWLAPIRTVRVKVPTFTKVISADADLGFGQKILDMPEGAFIPVATKFEIDVFCPTGLSAAVAANDGELSLGTVVASGAIDDMSGTATFEDISGGPLALAALVANTTVSQNGIICNSGLVVFDGTSTAKDIFLNIAASWNQTSAEAVRISGYVELSYLWLGDD